MSKKKKLIIIGLDGATWTVLNPLLKWGHLPNINELVNNGSHGTLESTFPPLTIPAWLSMATGKNPGKLGVFDFVTKKENDFSGRVVNSHDFKKNNTYWDLLNQYGFITYIINHPLIYPIYDINGVMISGLGTPPDVQKISPSDVSSTLEKLTNGYPTSLPSNLRSKEKFLYYLNEISYKQHIAAKFLFNQNWDLILYVTSISDWLQHFMWEDWINTQSEYHKKFIGIWKQIDKNIGELLSKYKGNCNIFIVSDHGFGSLKQNFNLTKWLYVNGYLKKKTFSNIRSVARFFISKIFHITKSISFVRRIYNLFLKRQQSGSFLNIGYPIPPDVDINKSIVIPGHTSGYQGFLYLKESCDIALKNKIISQLKQTAKDYDFKIEFFEANDIYRGDKAKLAPDIIFKINNFNCNIQISSLKGEIFSNKRIAKKESGVHRTEGVFIAYGPDISNNQNHQNFRIYDVFPTILHMFNIPIPKNIDGQVLKHLFNKNSEYFSRNSKIEFRSHRSLKDKIKDLKKRGKI